MTEWEAPTLKQNFGTFKRNRGIHVQILQVLQGAHPGSKRVYSTLLASSYEGAFFGGFLHAGLVVL